ncbi:hypothetical protein AB0471_05000, partial [Streptomyces sp. NPDC052002]
MAELHDDQGLGGRVSLDGAGGLGGAEGGLDGRSALHGAEGFDERAPMLGGFAAYRLVAAMWIRSTLAYRASFVMMLTGN